MGNLKLTSLSLKWWIDEKWGSELRCKVMYLRQSTFAL